MRSGLHCGNILASWSDSITQFWNEQAISSARTSERHRQVLCHGRQGSLALLVRSHTYLTIVTHNGSVKPFRVKGWLQGSGTVAA